MKACREDEDVEEWDGMTREQGDNVGGQLGSNSTSTSIERKKKLSSSARVGQRYGCEQCGKMFKYRYCVENHKRVHTGILLFKCDFAGCTRKFKWRSSLNSHRSTHKTGPRKPSCSQMTTSIARTLVGGAIGVRNNSPAKALVGDAISSPKQCPLCSKSFWTRTERMAHEKAVHRSMDGQASLSIDKGPLLRSQRVEESSGLGLIDTWRKDSQAGLLPHISSVHEGLRRSERNASSAADDGAREATETLLLFADSASRTVSNDDFNNARGHSSKLEAPSIKKSENFFFPGSPISHAQSGVLGPVRTIPSLVDESRDLGLQDGLPDGILPRLHYPPQVHPFQGSDLLAKRPVVPNSNNTRR
mmetsp:Transcript_3286/g.10058  ORF Transcript_3286/g.10058 Transcript_3286/m.10058 type:complete len:360 (-) Transcript_3286:48-1127(-)